MRGTPIGKDSRVALLAPTGSSYRYTMSLATESILRTSLGYVLESTSEPQRIAFRVLVSTRSMTDPLVLFETERLTESEGVWVDEQIDLSRWSGQEIQLILETSGAPGAWAAWGAPEVIAKRQERPLGWDLLLVSLDTVRADHLSGYGYSRPTSPNLDSLAAGGYRFQYAVSSAPWTRPAHRSMLTGLFPASKKRPQTPALARLLWEAGYRTGAVTGGGQIDRKFGFQDGFETYRSNPSWIQEPEGVLDWFQEGRARRNFLFLHTYQAHDPYLDRRFTEGLDGGRITEGFSTREWSRFDKSLTDEEKVYVEALYDGNIALADARLGSLLDLLSENGVLEQTIVIVTSDHGEQFWEHGSWRHGSTMYDHQLLVPLILWLPPALETQWAITNPNRVIDRQVSLVDLVPTVTELLEIPRTHEVDGRSLVGLLEGESIPPVAAFSEETNIRQYERHSLRTERFKFIHSFPRPGRKGQVWFELYDLRNDPEEQHNLAKEYPEMVAALLAQTEAIGRGGGSSFEGEVPEGVDEELRLQLEALGYLGNR